MKAKVCSATVGILLLLSIPANAGTIVMRRQADDKTTLAISGGRGGLADEIFQLTQVARATEGFAPSDIMETDYYYMTQSYFKGEYVVTAEYTLPSADLRAFETDSNGHSITIEGPVCSAIFYVLKTANAALDETSNEAQGRTVQWVRSSSGRISCSNQVIPLPEGPCFCDFNDR